MRQAVAQVAGEPVDEVVVRPVRLIHHHDDVHPLGQGREAGAGVLLVLGQAELLDRGEDDPAGLTLVQQLLQMVAGVRLHRGLRQRGTRP